MQAVTLKYIRKLSACSARTKGSTLTEVLASVEEELSKADAIDESQENADRFFSVFKLAFDSKQPELMEIALGAVHILIQRGHLLGKGTLHIGDTGGSSTNLSQMDDPEAAPAGDGPKEGEPAPQGRQRRVSVSKRPSMQRRDIDYIIESVTKCSEVSDDGVHLQTLKVLLTTVTSMSCEVHEASLLLAIQACFHVHLVSKNPVNKMTAKAALTQMVSSINAKMELVSGKEDFSESFADNGPGATDGAANRSFSTAMSQADEEGGGLFLSIAHKDSYLVFRALCKLSMKGLYDDSDLVHATRNARSELDVNAVAIQNKILSLELILHILQNCGPAFQSGDKICDAVRKYLCISLLGNCTSQIVQVSSLSMKIFLALMGRFKHHLKTEFEIFFTSIFFKMLESENSTHDHKLQVLEVFHKISSDQKTLIEFFINYDCDLDTSDVFRRIVDCFARIAKNPVSPNSTAVDEEKVRKMGIEGLVLILQSMLHAKGIVADAVTVDPPPSAGISEEDSSPQKLNGASDALDMEDGGSPRFSRLSVASMDGSTPLSAVDAFDRKQKMHEQIEIGIIKFNLNPKKGVEFLINVGYIENTPHAVAKFLLYEERLDKTQIGDFIGRETDYMGGFVVKVLHEYVELLDFAKMPFDLAIRAFLRGFRLPGEAQKIDRIMEKFAERYYLQNTDEFASADMAFILAFSTIMLQTNLHNSAIKQDKKMTKEQFLKQNTGITSDGELSHELLKGIYDRIQMEPISMTDDKAAQTKKDEDTKQAAGTFSGFQVSEESRRMDAFNDERKEMMRKGQSLFKKKNSSKNSLFVKSGAFSSDEAYVRPMFEACWAPIMAALSYIFEGENDPATIELTLQGFECATRLACRLDFPIVRAAYVNILAKCTALDRLREIQSKNAESVKVLMSIATTEREFLEESWYEVLNCISQIARLLLFANGEHADDLFFSSSVAKVDTASAGIFASFFGGTVKDTSETRKKMEEANSDWITSEISIADIDRIFHTSHKLSAESVQHFVRALCAVSIEEITNYQSLDALASSSSGKRAPRIFSLQKLVEVADFNMHSRSRIEWGNIWSLLAVHFTAVGTHNNQSLAMYAIDSLKQLSIKFLQKEELSNFNFQRIFLKPFEVIIAKTSSIEIQDLVLHCIETMILQCAGNIRSGWRSIFAIFEVCANHASLEVAAMALRMIERLMETRFDIIFQDFVEVVNCFVVFSASAHTKLSLRALKHLNFCADKLAAGENNEVLPKNMPALLGEDATVFRMWWPLILGLATRVSDSRLEVRLRAFNTLSDILKNYGKRFSTQAWKMLFKGILFPMMDSAKTDQSGRNFSQYPTENPFLVTDSNSWIDTVGLKVLNLSVELFLAHEPVAERLLILPELLNMIEGCICQETETLSRMGMGTFADLVLGLGKMDTATADLICSYVCSLIMKNLCVQYGPAGTLQMSPDLPSSAVAMYSTSANKCPIQARRSSICDEKVATVFGEGIMTNAVEPAVGDLPVRAVVQLPWGTLYGQLENFEDPVMANVTKIVSAQTWEEVSKSAMTSMIVSLDIVHVIRAMFESRDCGASAENLQDILRALEASHWHARSFNEDERLSVVLQSMAFMRFKNNPTRPPNLLEQEIRTASTNLFISHQLGAFKSHTKQAEKWAKRYTDIVFLRYIELDSSLQNGNPIEDDLIDAYKPTVVDTLQRLLEMSAEKLKIYEKWLVPIITKLILCADYDIRAQVANLLARIAHRDGDSPVHSPLK